MFCENVHRYVQVSAVNFPSVFLCFPCRVNSIFFDMFLLFTFIHTRVVTGENRGFLAEFYVLSFIQTCKSSTPLDSIHVSYLTNTGESRDNIDIGPIAPDNARLDDPLFK
jgi:hypothetical protein